MATENTQYRIKRKGKRRISNHAQWKRPRSVTTTRFISSHPSHNSGYFERTNFLGGSFVPLISFQQSTQYSATVITSFQKTPTNVGILRILIHYTENVKNICRWWWMKKIMAERLRACRKELVNSGTGGDLLWYHGESLSKLWIDDERAKAGNPYSYCGFLQGFLGLSDRKNRWEIKGLWKTNVFYSPFLHPLWFLFFE